MQIEARRSNMKPKPTIGDSFLSKPDNTVQGNKTLHKNNKRLHLKDKQQAAEPKHENVMLNTDATYAITVSEKKRGGVKHNNSTI